MFTPMAPPQKSSTMQSAVNTNVAPRSSRRRASWFRRECLGRRIGYELGVETWSTLVEDSWDGVMMLIPGSSGNSGFEL